MSVDHKTRLPETDAPLSRLPELSATVISKDLRQEIEKLKAAPSWRQAAGRSSETLAKYPDFRIVLIVMKAGTQLGKHHADGRISLQVIEGRIRFHVFQGESPDAQSTDLGTGGLLALEYGLKHDVEAMEESAVLLTVAWPYGAH